MKPTQVLQLNFALSAGLFLLSWGNTLLSQVNPKATEKTEAARGPWSWGLWSCLGHGRANYTGLLWVSPSLTMSQNRFHSFSGLVFDQPDGEQIFPTIQLAFLIFHIVLTALWPNSERSLALAFAFAGLGEVPDGSFLGLKFGYPL